MADPVFADGVTPLNAANMNKLQTRDEKAAANGYPSLDATGKVPAAQLPPLGTSSATSFSYTYAAAIAEPPANGQVRLDNASLWDVTKLWISYLTTDGHNAYGPLTQIQSGNILSLRAGDNYLFFMVTAYRKVGSDTSGYIEFTGYAWDGTDVFPAPGPVTLDLLWGLPFPNPPIDNYVLTGLAGQTVWKPPSGGVEYLGPYNPSATYNDGDYVVGPDGVTYQCVKNGTTGITPAPWTPVPPVIPYGTTLPLAPTDGQEAILVDSVANPSYQWRFRYNAGSTSAYKWEFIGGAPATISFPGTVTPSGASAWVKLSAPLFTLPRAGDWHFAFSAWVGGIPAPPNGASNVQLAVWCKGAGGPGSSIWLDAVVVAGALHQVAQPGVDAPGLPQNDPIGLACYVPNVAITWSALILNVLPKRVA